MLALITQLAGVRSVWSDWTACRKGGMLVTFALMVPVLAVLVAGAVELAMVSKDKASLQEVADSIALAGANEMALASDASVVERARARVTERLAAAHSEMTLVVTPAVIVENGDSVGLKIDVTGTRPSFFGNLLPPGGFVLNVSSSAKPMGTAPLCVFGLQGGTYEAIRVGGGKITAGECLVHTNGNGYVAAGSTVLSASMQAVGTIAGTPPANALLGAKSVADPFATWNTAPPSWNNCLTVDQKVNNSQTLTLAAGVHCGKVEIGSNATLTLAPGVHYFRDWMQVKQNGRLEGSNVTIVIGALFYFDLNGDTGQKINLYGNQTGQWAGFVMIADRARTNFFTVQAPTIERLEGVVYSPNAPLIISGAAAAAQSSAWTVVVAKDLRIQNSADLFINANYSASQVPVPSGVGNKAKFAGGSNRLTQ